MSRSSTDALVIGIGTRDIAIGMPRAKRPEWAAACKRAAQVLRRARRGGECAETTPATAVSHRLINIETTRCYTEEGALDALTHALADTGIHTRARRRATFVLDDFWGYHAILQGDLRALRAKEIDEVTAAYFADTYGVDATTLSVRWQVQPGGRSLFASALPRSLIEGIRARAQGARFGIASLTLALPQTLNRARSAIAGRNGWLLVATGTLLHAVTIDDRGWSAYDTERLFHENASDAEGIADAARQLFGRSAASHEEKTDVYLCGLALDPAPFQQRFARVHALREHMSNAPGALRLMELAP